MRRTCDVCGRKFRYPGFTFEPLDPSLAEHVHWAHDNMSLRWIPSSERDRRAYVAVYQELLRADDHGFAAMMGEVAKSDHELSGRLGAQSSPETSAGSDPDTKAALAATVDLLRAYKEDDADQLVALVPGREAKLLAGLLLASDVAVDGLRVILGEERVLGIFDNWVANAGEEREARIALQMVSNRLSFSAKQRWIGDTNIGGEEMFGLIVFLAFVVNASVEMTAMMNEEDEDQYLQKFHEMLGNRG